MQHLSTNVVDRQYVLRSPIQLSERSMKPWLQPIRMYMYLASQIAMLY